MFILAAKVIKRIKERSALTMIVNSNEKDSTVTKLYTELLLNHYFNNNNLYNNSNYKNNINFRLCNYD